MDKDSLDRTEGLEIIRRRGDAKREIPVWQDRTGQREREETVSYTHLTLPTKLEV